MSDLHKITSARSSAPSFRSVVSQSKSKFAFPNFNDRDDLFEYLSSDSCLVFRESVSLGKKALNTLLRIGGSTEMTILLIDSLNNAHIQFADALGLCEGMKAEIERREHGKMFHPNRGAPSMVGSQLSSLYEAARSISPASGTGGSSWITPEDRDRLFAYLADDECLIFRVELNLGNKQLNQLLNVCSSVEECIELISALNTAHLQYGSISDLVEGMEAEQLRRAMEGPPQPMVRLPSTVIRRSPSDQIELAGPLRARSPASPPPPPARPPRPITPPRIRPHPLLSNPLYLALCMRFLDRWNFIVTAQVNHSWRAGAKKTFELLFPENQHTIVIHRKEQQDSLLRAVSNRIGIVPYKGSDLPQDSTRAGVPYVRSNGNGNGASASSSTSPIQSPKATAAATKSERSMWSAMRSVRVEYNFEPLPSVISSSSGEASSSRKDSTPRGASSTPFVTALLQACPKLRSLSLSLRPPPETYTPSMSMGRHDNPYISSFTPSLLGQVSSALTSLSLVDSTASARFSPVHATRIFHLVTSKLLFLRFLDFRWKMVHQLSSTMQDHVGFRRPSELTNATIDEGTLLHLDSLLHLDQLERLKLWHVEFSTRAGEVLHVLSTRYRLRWLSWTQREAITEGSEKFDPREDRMSMNFPNDLGAFNALLANPPSGLSHIEWIQPNGKFTASDIRCLLAFPALTSLRIDVRHIEFLSSILAVLATCHHSRSEQVRPSGGHVFLRSLDVSCVGDSDASAVNAANWVSPADHAAVSWSAALARLPTLTKMTLRHTSILPGVLRNLGAGLNQLKHLVLHSCSLNEQPFQMMTQQLFYRLETLEIAYDRSMDVVLSRVLARTALTLPSLRRLAIIYCEVFRLDQTFVEALGVAPSMQEFHLLPPRDLCHFDKSNRYEDPRADVNSSISIFDQSKEDEEWNEPIASARHPSHCCTACTCDYSLLAQVRADRARRHESPIFIRYRYTTVE